MKTRPASLSVCLLAATLAACEALPPKGPVEQTEAHLNGTINFGPGCDSPHRELLRDTMNLVVFPIVRQDDSNLLKCLKDVPLTGGVTLGVGTGREEVTYPEFILRRMKENMPTSVDCDNLVNSDNEPIANAIATSATSEAMVFDRSFLNRMVDTFGWQGAIERIAGTFLHEIAHNKMYQHPTQGGALEAVDNKFSVPVEASNCMIFAAFGGTGDPSGRDRSALSPETTLAPVGLENGTPIGPASTHCSGEDYIAGLWGRTSGSAIDAIGIRCRNLNGADSFKQLFGGSTGSQFNLGCFSGELAVGVHGTADSVINSVGMVCQSRADILQDTLNNRFVDGTVGGTGGMAWSRTCPKGLALKAVRLRTGLLVDRMELVCYDPGVVPVSHDLNFQAPFGGPGNSSSRLYFEQCPGRAIMTGVEANSGALIDRLAGNCQTVARRSGNMLMLDINVPIPGHGGWGGTWANRSNCFNQSTLNSALIGLRLTHEGRSISSVANICTDDMRSWANGVMTPKRITGGTGSSSFTTADIQCPPGQFPVGWKLKAGTSGVGFPVVENIQLACRAL
jgi:hypothetical protein